MRFLQGQYTQAFLDQGIEVQHLRNLNNNEIKQLVPTEGHKRRLVRANRNLFPAATCEGNMMVRIGASSAA